MPVAVRLSATRRGPARAPGTPRRGRCRPSGGRAAPRPPWPSRCRRTGRAPRRPSGTWRGWGCGRGRPGRARSEAPRPCVSSGRMSHTSPGLLAAGVVAEEVEAALLELASAARHGAHVRVRRALAAADDHAEVGEAAGGDLAERLLERRQRRRLLELVQRRRELDLAAVAHAADAGGGDDGAVLHARRAGRAPDGVGVVEVAPGPAHEVEQELVHVAQLVAARVGAALDLVPHDAVAQRPSLVVGEVEGDAPRDAQLAFAPVRVAEVQPQRAGGLERPQQFGGDGAEGVHVVLPDALGADAAAGVATVAEVGRAGDDAVDGRGGEEAERLGGVAAEEERRGMGFAARAASVAQVDGERSRAVERCPSGAVHTPR